MKSFLVLDGQCPADIEGLLQTSEVWRFGGDGPGNDLGAEVAARLARLRVELNAWTVDTGRAQIHGRSVEDWLCAGERPSMWWCSTLTEKHPKVTHGLFEVFLSRVLEERLDKAGASELTLVSDNDALVQTLRHYCAVTGRRFNHRLPPLTSLAFPPLLSREGLRRVYRALPPLLKALGRFPLWLWLQKRYLPRTRMPASTARAAMVTYFPNIDMNQAKEGRYRSRYWEGLHDALTENGPAPVDWLFLFFPSSQCTLKEAVALHDNFAANGTDGKSFHFLEEFLDRRAICRAVKRFRLLRGAAKHIENAVAERFVFQGSRLNFWPLLKENWLDSLRGWRCLERCLMHEAFKAYAVWTGKREYTVYVQENCPWERMLCQTLHDAGVGKVYGMQHSTVRPTDLRYFDDPRLFADPAFAPALPDLFLNNGTGAQRALVEAGMPAARSVLVEALRYQYLDNATAEAANAVKPLKPAEAGETVEISESSEIPATARTKRLLICTSFFADETEAHLRLLAAAYVAGALEGFELCLKPHPYLPVDRRLAELFPHGGAPAILSGAIADQLLPGTVVWASNSTTVALEAAYQGLPVLVTAPVGDFDLSPVQDLDVPFVRTPDDVRAALHSATPPTIPPNYLCLDKSLPRWRKLLAIR